MSNLTKILIPVVVVFAAYAIYILKPTDEIGSFDTVRAGGEINQVINVLVNPSKGFDQNSAGMVTAFYATDKNNQDALISLKEAIPAEIKQAKVIEVFGHMHGNTYIANRVTILE